MTTRRYEADQTALDDVSTDPRPGKIEYRSFAGVQRPCSVRMSAAKFLTAESIIGIRGFFRVKEHLCV